jgi:two-component system phosphate regulon sensor histidine kinase PhoR
MGIGAGLGFFWAQSHDTIALGIALLLGALVAIFVWWTLDALRGFRVITWLRRGELAQAPQIYGLWGEVVDRARRLLRDRQRALDASDQRLTDFLLAIQASPNGVLLLDDRAQIEWCNQTAAQQLGIDPVRDLSQRIGNLLRDPVFTEYMNSQDTQSPVVLSGREDRQGHPVRISIHRHPYGEGKQLLLTRDVTALEQADAMRRDFVANVSHEIRTPLTVLSGFVETLQTLPLSPQEQKRYLELMANQAHRMQSLVEDLLTLSRLEGSPSPGFHNTVLVEQFMRVCHDEAQALSSMLYAQQPAQIFELSWDDRLQHARLMGDPRELQSALSNLVSNAVRYTPAGGRIEMRASLLPDDRLCLKVIDSGPGIAAEHIPRLTERFYRVDKSRSRDSGGTGLGLAIVKHVAQRHGGTLTIQSALGRGSTFSLVFPLERYRL